MAQIETDDKASAPRFLVGLTGGIGSGKSIVADMFASYGAAIIDTDLIAHQLTAPDGAAIPDIRKTFGNAFIAASGAMDRIRMREHVFSEPQARHALEAILHPLIRDETERAALTAESRYLILVVPLLIEADAWRQRVSRILVIDCPEELQIRRVMQRNKLSESQVRAIMAAQAPRTVRLAAADDVVINDGDIENLEHQVAALHALYCTLAPPQHA